MPVLNYQIMSQLFSVRVAAKARVICLILQFPQWCWRFASGTVHQASQVAGRSSSPTSSFSRASRWGARAERMPCAPRPGGTTYEYMCHRRNAATIELDKIELTHDAYRRCNDIWKCDDKFLYALQRQLLKLNW